eukprot:scaffold1301_cov135-Isochrysis_galbana.AAC.1
MMVSRMKSVQVTVVHNTFSDREGKRHYTKDENRSYIDTELDYHYFQNKRINNERFLASWDTITQHCDTNIIPFQPSNQKKPNVPARGGPENIQITTEGEYVLHIEEGHPFKATQNTLGELNIYRRSPRRNPR